MISKRYRAALDFAEKKHNGQFRKGGLPYITHPMAVADILKEKKYDEEYQIAGLFHDLLEDTDATEEDILSFGNADILEAVKLLTKTKGYVMEEYITGILGNPMAKAVKAADRLHNLTCAVVCDENFKRRYILESIDWYFDFDEEIPGAIKRLADTMEAPIRTLSMEYDILSEKEEMRTPSFVMKGDICHALSASEIETVSDGYLVCVDGQCCGVFEECPESYRNLPLYDYTGELILPGFADLHIHAPQYAFRGLGMDLELMDWLKERTFPEESKYEDLAYAEKAYSVFADAMKKSATTHACIFATKHREATELLMDRMDRTGIFSYVGKVNMDREAPDALREVSSDYSAFDTFGWINHTNNKYKRTRPILTPRFIPCCSPELLEQLREIRNAYDLPVQSHLSENLGEVEFVRQLAPDVSFYGEAYDNYGLFGAEHSSEHSVPTVMAHCVYSTPEEMQRMKDNGVFVAHCPSSNMNLSSGIAPIRKYLDMGLSMGLGSDVAGGQMESIPRAVCDAIQVSKMYWRLVDSSAKPLTFREAFFLATKGGGAFFGNVGNFEPGAEFNAVVLKDALLPRVFDMTVEERVERGLYQSLDLFGLHAKFVCGEKIYENESLGGCI